MKENVLSCLKALEVQGFSCYAVGGCVRDAVLGLTPHDYDLCTSATPVQMKEIFSGYPLVLAGEKHGTVGVITGGEVVEITTYRTEGEYLDNRHPERVTFVDRVEEDLARRDFTVNAMAWSPIRGFADPFGGREDLKNRILRAVGDPETRFREDSLRILRGVRFSVTYGLTPEPETEKAMFRLAGLMDHLARERVFDELSKLIVRVTPEDLLRFAPVITAAIPELAPAVGFDQRNPHHAYDVYAHTARVVGGVAADLTLRWAALLHDVGKPAVFTPDETGRGHFPGHAAKSAEMANEILLRLKAPTALRQQVVFLVEKHMTPLEPDRKLLRRRLSRYGREPLRRLLALQAADFGAKGVTGDKYPAEEIEAVLSEILEENACFSLKDLAVKGGDLIALGYAGPEIGRALNRLLELVVSEEVPNEKGALLAAIREYE